MKTKNVVRGIGISMALASLGILAGCLALSTDEASSGAGAGRCASVQDCPTPATCKTMQCIEGDCITEFASSGIQCNETRFCDGAGTCVGCLTNGDCQGTNPTCENNECISCSDGIKNGSEINIDCGGSTCAACGPGTPCSSATDCLDNNCIDGFCCDTSCTGICRACNQAGKEGTCSVLPKGTEDPGKCDNKKACSANGNCLLKDGQSCTQGSQCLNASCFMGFCF